VSYLPLIGAVLGAVVGGFVGAFANGWIRDHQEKEAQDRERKGLLTLIDAEVHSHIIAWGNLKEELDARKEEPIKPAFKVDPNILATPRTEDWDRFKDRLAQLLEPGHMKDLIIYYKVLKDVVALTSHEPAERYRADVLSALSEPLIAQGNAIREHGKKYLKRLPDYSESGFGIVPDMPTTPADGLETGQ
jgi:hypothetical protein